MLPISLLRARITMLKLPQTDFNHMVEQEKLKKALKKRVVSWGDNKVHITMVEAGEDEMSD
jgi:hypothetical protein